MRKKRFMLLLAGMVVSALMLSATASAGSINTNEQSVLQVASGTFEYEGKTYVAKESYLNQLRDKLNSDDTDLTAGQAQAAISKIMSNVEVGVKEGYLAPADESDISSTESPASKDADTSHNDTNQELSDGADTGDTKNDAANSTDSDKKTSAKDETVVPATKTLSIDVAKAVQMQQTFTRSSNDDVAKQLHNELNTMYMVMGISAAVLLAIMFILQMWKRKHFLRRILCPFIAITAITVSVLMIGIVSFLQFGFYRNGFVQECSVDNKYYDQVYEQLHTKTDKMMTAVGLPTALLGNVINEDEVYRDGKRYMESKNDSNSDYLDITAGLKKSLQEYAYNGGFKQDTRFHAQVEQLCSTMQLTYNAELEFPFTEYINERNASWKTKGPLVCGVCAIVILGMFLLLWFTQKYPHRVFRSLAAGCVIAGVSSFVPYAVAMMKGNIVDLQLKPEMYQSFFEDFVKAGRTNLNYIAGMEILLGIAFVIVLKVLKKRNTGMR